MLAAAVAAASVTAKVIRSLRNSHRTIPEWMDLALPKFAHPKKWSEQSRSLWIAMSEAPALPATSLRAPLISPSPCLNLDALSSDGSAGPGDVSDHLICISDVSHHSGDPDQVLSEDYLRHRSAWWTCRRRFG